MLALVDYSRPLLNGNYSNLTIPDSAAGSAVPPLPRVSSPQPRINQAPIQFFEIDMGGPTADLNPLNVFNVTGVRGCAPLPQSPAPDMTVLAGSAGASPPPHPSYQPIYIL